MARPGIYGDNMEISAFAWEYGCDVKIYQRDFAYIVTGREGGGDGGVEGKGKNVLHIAYHEVLEEAKGNIDAAVSRVWDAEEGGQEESEQQQQQEGEKKEHANKGEDIREKEEVDKTLGEEERIEETETEKSDAQASSESQDSAEKANNVVADTNSVKAAKRSAPKIGAQHQLA
ncbi:hypothetical protein B9Z19DRAFT_1138646 [Tuber borchii]|uniref:Uncharacterized protein n=1 Tax=Tuber borchii TaxID=42251 RepID=A0A2T6Z9Q1_TUBBO|nr:hypothetical protein B9Z19DRAFT_1138646 [Tuber borchii]